MLFQHQGEETRVLPGNPDACFLEYVQGALCDTTCDDNFCKLWYLTSADGAEASCTAKLLAYASPYCSAAVRKSRSSVTSMRTSSAQCPAL
eukprot:CAMPEP_0115687320 /NCGR_PEP_ID=MMETSP0272-20121206/60421_1 /TAXON_ID=71861 /ORGANISM="Scrippsiella trochoidea, Strain CCMP3099" /LENGTH=90 /DNA_ID=CAMNT_0003126947 /DNA_START=86 /DNA_END=354 /DNA_ORIENTATION=-